MRLFCVVSLFPVALMAVTPTFQHDVLPMFEQRCIACHGAKASGGLDLRTLASVMSGATNGKVVEPGKPDASRLWKMIDSGAMPMGSKALSLEEKSLVREWIENGQVEFRSNTETRKFWSYQKPVKVPTP